jgi:hypothetical protein
MVGTNLYPVYAFELRSKIYFVKKGEPVKKPIFGFPYQLNPFPLISAEYRVDKMSCLWHFCATAIAPVLPKLHPSGIYFKLWNAGMMKFGER